MSTPLKVGQPARERLPVRARDRRPTLAALALLLVVLGGLGAGLVVYRSGHKSDVLVAAHEIKPGQQVQASDFATARVSTDSGSVVSAADKGAYIGSYATTDIPAGSLLNHLMFQVSGVLPPNGVVVGVNVSAEARPARALSAGDVVRAYLVPKSGQSAALAASGQVLVTAARVVEVTQGSDSSQNAVTVSLLVGSNDADALIAAATQGDVALGRLPAGTTPDVDFRRDSGAVR